MWSHGHLENILIDLVRVNFSDRRRHSSLSLPCRIMFMLFGVETRGNSSVTSTCTYTNTFLLYQRTLCIIHILIYAYN